MTILTFHLPWILFPYSCKNDHLWSTCLNFKTWPGGTWTAPHCLQVKVVFNVAFDSLLWSWSISLASFSVLPATLHASQHAVAFLFFSHGIQFPISLPLLAPPLLPETFLLANSSSKTLFRHHLLQESLVDLWVSWKEDAKLRHWMDPGKGTSFILSAMARCICFLGQPDKFPLTAA